MNSSAATIPWLVSFAAILTPAATSPFATTSWFFEPAPGQFVNNSNFNDPSAALGAPDGSGSSEGNTSSVVSLGGFGGFIVLGFDHMIEDDPRNPFGLDAIVFGNATWVGGDPNRHWAECAIIEISYDANDDGMPNDPWYLIPGSHITDLEGQFMIQSWDDDDATETPPANVSWVPPGITGAWETSGFMLSTDLFGSTIVENPILGGEDEGIFGYGDFTPTLVLGDLDADNAVDDDGVSAEDFYTVPDDPFQVGILDGSGGGDAFDIAWAIDPIDGSEANLTGFHFIRLTNGVNAIAGFLGEKSPEIDAVSDVAPDPFGDADRDGDIDLADFARLQNCIHSETQLSESCSLFDRDDNKFVALADFQVWWLRITGPKSSQR